MKKIIISMLIAFFCITSSSLYAQPSKSELIKVIDNILSSDASYWKIYYRYAEHVTIKSIEKQTEANAPGNSDYHGDYTIRGEFTAQVNTGVWWTKRERFILVINKCTDCSEDTGDAWRLVILSWTDNARKSFDGCIGESCPYHIQRRGKNYKKNNSLDKAYWESKNFNK